MEFANLILVSQVNGVVMHAPPHKQPFDGTLCLTGHHIIFSTRKEGTDELWLMQQNVDALERKLNNTSGGSLIIKCKDFRIVRLDISSTDDLNNVATTIESIFSLNNILLMYPFFFQSSNPSMVDGWSFYTTEMEYRNILLNEEWRVTNVNRDYAVCGTYPSVLVVPRAVDDETVIASARFRDGGRFPIFSYQHEGGAILMRSGQPLVGTSSKRCKEDERLLNAVLGPGKRGYIIDTRPQNAAQAAKSKGGGCELEFHYPQWRKVHKPIERAQALLESLTKLVEACSDKSCSMDRWCSKLESSNWLSHIRDGLNCACLTAQCLHQEESSVLVHGSEGTDSTLLVTSITQIILNPDCRTVQGLQALITREWLQGGYPFRSRHGRGCFSSTNTGRTKANGCMFLLFLDCVWQIQNQFPCSFEFLPTFLVMLFENSYSSEFGTFLGDCEAERDMLDVAQKTVSLWSHLSDPKILIDYLNPLYLPNNEAIWPSVAPMSLILWRGLYMRWAIDITNETMVWKDIKLIVDNEKEQRKLAGQLRRELFELERIASEELEKTAS